MAKNLNSCECASSTFRYNAPRVLKRSLPTRVESSLRSLCSYPDPGLSSLFSHISTGANGYLVRLVRLVRTFLHRDQQGERDRNTSTTIPRATALKASGYHAIKPASALSASRPPSPSGAAAGAFHSFHAFFSIFRGSLGTFTTSFLAYLASRSIFFPHESAGRGAYLSFLSQSAFFFREMRRQAATLFGDNSLTALGGKRPVYFTEVVWCGEVFVGGTGTLNSAESQKSQLSLSTKSPQFFRTTSSDDRGRPI